MACRLVGAKPLSETILEYSQLDLYEQTSVKFNQNSNVFIQGNALENVDCEVAFILSRPQCDNGDSMYLILSTNLSDQLMLRHITKHRHTDPVIVAFCAGHAYNTVSPPAWDWISFHRTAVLIVVSYHPLYLCIMQLVLAFQCGRSLCGFYGLLFYGPRAR